VTRPARISHDTRDTFTVTAAPLLAPDHARLLGTVTWTVPLATQSGTPLAALPDAAFATVLHDVQAVPSTVAVAQNGDGHVSAPVAWSPNGQILATILPRDQFVFSALSIGKHSAITLLSVATGQPIKQLPYTCPTSTSQPDFSGCRSDGLPVWSPSGAQIAWLDLGAARLMIWKV
jgi:hypothetical protein